MNTIHKILACCVCLLCSQQPWAEESSVEYQIKAGYLYNFTKFITWPEEATETFNLCIVGNDPFGKLIDPIESRDAAGHPIKLIRLPHASTAKDIQKFPRCHILFIGSTVKNGELYQKLQNVLTVSEDDTFANAGEMISFVKREERIKCQINLQAFKQSGLKISAKLLEVSEIIKGDGHD